MNFKNFFSLIKRTSIKSFYYVKIYTYTAAI